jgi:hypothetical protein
LKDIYAKFDVIVSSFFWEFLGIGNWEFLF